MKSRIVAILLCFFLGGVGIHQFYLNNNGRGILYLVLGITGVGLIITVPLAIIDLISLMLSSDDKFNKKFNPA